MDITSYERLLNDARVFEQSDGIIVAVPQSWVVANETRVSYTTLIRLIECCREYHWKKDVQDFSLNFDSICGQIDVRFEQPICPQTEIEIKYRVANVFEKKYILDFTVFSSGQKLCCYARMTIYLYDGNNQRSLIIPDNIRARILGKE